MDDINEFNPNWKEDILALAEEGATHGEFYQKTGVCRSSYYNILGEQREGFEEFLDTINKAIGISQAWWELKARTDGIEAGKVNSVIFSLNLCNKFREDWKHKQEIGYTDGEGKDIQPVTITYATPSSTYEIIDGDKTETVIISED